MLIEMIFRIPSKPIIIVLLLCFAGTSVIGLVFTVFGAHTEHYNLYIRLIDISWPPTSEEIIQSDTYVGYGVPMVFELWNPTKKTYTFTTPNSNLLDPQMKIELDEDYPYLAGYLFWIIITTHEIEPGITVREAAMSIHIDNYNNSIPPSGKYTVWAGIVGNPESHNNPLFSYKSYRTVISQNKDNCSIEYSSVPENWGSTSLQYWEYLPDLLWSFSGVELVIIVYLLIRHYRTR